MEKITRAHIWKKLSNVAVKDFCTEEEVTEDNTVLLYLPWMKAHEMMMDNYPEYRWEFSEDPTGREVHYFDDGSAEVRCKMTVEGHTNITYLPVHRRGKAIVNPNSMQINVAKQRARVKALGEFGLGYKLWLDSAVKTPPAPTTRDDAPSESVKQSDLDQVEEIWANALPELLKAENAEAGKRIYLRFTRGLDNRGLEDGQPKRWASICKKQGWKVK
jgi:hypothetical protein